LARSRATSFIDGAPRPPSEVRPSLTLRVPSRC
jgi:hypothetical protein